MSTPDVFKDIQATGTRLAQMDPQDEAVGRVIDNLEKQIAFIGEQAREDQPGFSRDSMQQDQETLRAQIQHLKSAAMKPTKTWNRVYSILEALNRAVVASERPVNAAVRPRLAAILSKMAGVFELVDTVEDLDKPLEAIEKAVHGLYGDQSKNSTYYLDRRGKGHYDQMPKATETKRGNLLSEQLKTPTY